MAAAWVKENGQANLYYIHTDHLGSICAITDEGQNVVANYSFDAWGNRRDPDTWELTDTRDESFTARGFTGHEHIDEFGLINMNGRVYDPTIGQFLSPDNYVQLPDYSLGFNRYSYALNNPLIYTDPSGEIWNFMPWLINTAMTAGWSYLFAKPGLDYAQSQGYGWNDWQTYAYGIGSWTVNTAALLTGVYVAEAAIPLNSTASMVGSSAVQSGGMHLLTEGQTDFAVGFGFGSYNFGEGEFRSLFNWNELSTMEKIGYSLGTFGNLSDIYGFALGAYGTKAEDVELVTKNDLIGHSELRIVPDAKGNTENIISVGPDWDRAVRGDSFWDAPGYNDWPTHANDVGLDGLTVSKIRISNVRLDKINQYVSGNLKNFRYSALNTNCVTSVSNALLKAGVLNMPFLRHPSLLQIQMFARRYSYLSPYMTNP